MSTDPVTRPGRNRITRGQITINVPLFKKLRDIIFILFFDCPTKKNYVPKFLKQRDIGNFMYPSAVVYCCCVLLSVVGSNTVLTKFNTVLTKKNTVLTKKNTVLAKVNRVLTKVNSTEY